MVVYMVVDVDVVVVVVVNQNVSKCTRGSNRDRLTSGQQHCPLDHRGMVKTEM